MKIGLLGGTFNPIHNGHLALADEARLKFGLDEVWFIPAGDPYQKDKKDLLPASVRYNLVANATNYYIEWAKVSSIEVNGAAIEIDGGYESKSKVVLVEAKNSMPEDFVIRQLYYPYRHWKEKIVKEIVPVFFAYDNGIYNMFIYSFENLYDYNSLKLNCIKRYMISSNTSENIKSQIYENISLIDELPQNIVPLPQADSFSKVIGTLELINNDVNTANDISVELEFDKRQGKYYIDALRYLDLVQKGDKIGEYKLTPSGLAQVSVDVKIRNKRMIEYILKHKPFYEAYKYYVDNDEFPSREFIKSIIKKYIPDMSEETVNRRASTIRGWIQWIIGAQI